MKIGRSHLGGGVGDRGEEGEVGEGGQAQFLKKERGVMAPRGAQR